MAKGANSNLLVAHRKLAKTSSLDGLILTEFVRNAAFLALLDFLSF